MTALPNSSFRPHPFPNERPPTKPAEFIEVKPPGKAEDSVRQALEPSASETSRRRRARRANEVRPYAFHIYATLAWVNRKARDYASARMNFTRAHELGCKDRDAYWHWSEMEAANREWKASADAAALGIAKFGDDQGLLFRHGYALHRQGKELIIEEGSPNGVRLCQKAQAILEKALKTRTSEDRNFTLRNQIFRAIALNLEVLDDGTTLAKHFAGWATECPDDTYFHMEYERLRQKYPQYLPMR